MTTQYLLGIDEVGRGSWAGPLVIGAVILGGKFANFTELKTRLERISLASQGDGTSSDQNAKRAKLTPAQQQAIFLQSDLFCDSEQVKLYQNWLKLTDSKKLTEKKRQELNNFILDNAAATALGWVTASEIDLYGLSAALKLAARRAVEQIIAQNHEITKIVIDGTINFLDKTPLSDRVTLLPKADFLVKEVSAASITAKVARDNYMKNLASQYPNYGFDRHVGYGTAAHKRALLDYGICPEHRLSFRPVQTIAQDPLDSSIKNHNTATLSNNHVKQGSLAENLVADYLVRQGHEIVAQNFKTKICEIDIISRQGNNIIFTEVKYRLNHQHGTALEQITPQKRQQMQRAAEIYLALHPVYHNLQPLLAAASVSGLQPRLEDWFIITD